MNNKISFWLIPAREDRAYLQDIIETLAKEYEAPVFTPHVTIYSGEYQPEVSLDSIIEQAIRKVPSFSLNVEQILYTKEFTKTIFVQFHPNLLLSQISETLHNSSTQPSQFTLNPHLSLIYQHLNEVTQKNIIAKLNLAKSEVLFNEVRAILTGKKVQTTADVESWKVICKKNLQRQ